jgi:hypothetical protein
MDGSHMGKKVSKEGMVTDRKIYIGGPDRNLKSFFLLFFCFQIIWGLI